MNDKCKRFLGFFFFFGLKLKLFSLHYCLIVFFNYVNYYQSFVSIKHSNRLPMIGTVQCSVFRWRSLDDIVYSHQHYLVNFRFNDFPMTKLLPNSENCLAISLSSQFANEIFSLKVNKRIKNGTKARDGEKGEIIICRWLNKHYSIEIYSHGNCEISENALHFILFITRSKFKLKMIKSGWDKRTIRNEWI